MELQLKSAWEGIQEIDEELHSFTEEFDVDIEHQANQAGFEAFKNKFNKIKREHHKKASKVTFFVSD